MCTIMLNILLIAASASASTRSLSQFATVNNQGLSDFNITVIKPENTGLTDELGNQTFFASPGLGFTNAFLLTAVTTQAEDTFNQITSGSQQVNAGSGVSILRAGSEGTVTGSAELPNDNSSANITSFTRQDSSAEASNVTVGEGISTGQFSTFGLLLNGSGLQQATDSASVVGLEVTGFRLDASAVVDGDTNVVAPTARTVMQGETGAVVNPNLVATQCTGQNIGQAVNGQISQGSNCVLSVTFGV